MSRLFKCVVHITTCHEEVGTLVSNIVPAVKELRTFTGLPLKEAKDIIDSINASKNPGFTGDSKSFIVTAEQVGILTYLIYNGGVHLELVDIEEYSPNKNLIDVSSWEVAQ